MKTFLLCLIGTTALAAGGVPLAAQDTVPTQASFAPQAFDQFAPRPSGVETRIDYTVWDEALNYFVFRMGKSIRETPPSVRASLNTRFVYGHDSRYRLEGNRVVFYFLTDEVKASLVEYRADLERTANRVDITQLPRNEQLAFWINLHNSAVIEQIAMNYPVKQVREIRLNGSERTLDETPFITIRGTQLSPKDIRTKIVYPNWSDPKVMYGFFRGEIGGPSLRTDAFTGDNVGDLLDAAAREFVNSLRGVQKYGKAMKISEIYEEARPELFPSWPTDLREHIGEFAEGDVQSILERTSRIDADIYEYDVADLGKGGYNPNYGGVSGACRTGSTVPCSIQRLMVERAQKVEKLIKRNELVGRVILIDIDLPGEDPADKEID